MHSGEDYESLELNFFDVLCRCFADLLINFVYPIFLFMVFPVFVARSASYMGAISTATGVLFAVGWDAEPVNVDLTIPPPDPPLDRGEASA